MVSLSGKEQQILNEIYNIPLTLRPATVIGKKLGISSIQVLEIISDLKKRGVIRRIGPVFSHRELGYSYNAMILFKVDEKSLDRAAAVLSRKKEISHVFQRNNKYGMNLYAMVHAKSKEQLKKIINRVVDEAKMPILVAKTVQELKKDSLTILKEVE